MADNNDKVPVEDTKDETPKTYLDEVTGEHVSKTELKKRQKLREKEAKLAEKQKAKEAKEAAQPKKENICL